MAEEKALRLEGSVEHVLFTNEKNGYTVLELDVDEKKHRISLSM